MSKWLAILALLVATSASAAGFSIGGKAYPSRLQILGNTRAPPFTLPAQPSL